MKFLKILLGIIIVLVIVFFAGGLFLPKTYSMSRTTVINAPDSVIYNNIADFNQFMKWNPWLKKEPTAKVTINGTPGQVGHSYTWKGEDNNTGEGSMTLKELQPFKLITEDLTFVKPMQGVSDVTFSLEPAPNGIKVDWTMSGESKSTFDKWCGMMMGVIMGKDFENGLKDLKELSEKK